MKTIIFARSANDCDARGVLVNLLERDDKSAVSEVLAGAGTLWFQEFSAWLGELNRRNAGLLWWARTSTAKNLLSSPLGERFIQVQAVCEVLKGAQAGVYNVLGATPGQMEAISLLLSDRGFRFSGKAWERRFWTQTIRSVAALLRQFVQSGRVLAGFWRYRVPHHGKSPALCLFTYLDAPRPTGADRYFGSLPQILFGPQDTSSLYLAYVYRPYRSRLREVAKANESIPYVALFSSLHATDRLWALTNAIRQWWRNLRRPASVERTAYEPLLREAFIHDLAAGGYLHHLLVYRAMRRFFTDHMPRALIYPFENKAIEKMVLLAAADAPKPPRTVGYQHTAITPRHASALFFTPGEAQCTPLPDKIITCGKLTRELLESRGNYPRDIFTTGCALRQVWGRRLPRPEGGRVQVLLALSSSQQELTRATAFFRGVKQRMPQLELGIRPHPTFPLSMLPPDLARWVADHARDFSGTSLADNLRWCSVTAYISSTVALEALMFGRPIVGVTVGEFVSTDPVIGEAPFHWVAHDEPQMIEALAAIRDMPDDRYEIESAAAAAYVNDYLAPLDAQSQARFQAALEG